MHVGVNISVQGGGTAPNVKCGGKMLDLDSSPNSLNLYSLIFMLLFLTVEIVDLKINIKF